MRRALVDGRGRFRRETMQVDHLDDIENHVPIAAPSARIQEHLA